MPDAPTAHLRSGDTRLGRRFREPVAVLGTGMAGLGAAQRFTELGIPCVLYDEKPYIGGHTATFGSGDGFLFDEGPHVSFTKNLRVQELLAENVGRRFRTLDAAINNYWRGHWIRHPAQLNLHGLPTDLVVDIVKDLVERRSRPGAPVANYEDWLIEAFGATFARTFPIPYNIKYQTTEPHNLVTEWLGPRMYRPELEEVLQGALAPQLRNVHYVTQFRYPEVGGFQAFLLPFADGHDVRLDHRLAELDPAGRTLRFGNGREARYSEVVSSIPLPTLIPLVTGVPDDVKDAARALSYSSVVIVNVGVDRDDLSDAHISYVYDDDIIFARINFPHMLSPSNAPPGAGSVQAEVYFSKYRPLRVSAHQLIEPVTADLRRCGILRDGDGILHRSAHLVPFANVIYDFDREAALAKVHGFLDDVGIRYCGRYGDWNHAWTDEAFESGERAAERVGE
jgi:protoporphyrinogen oxidase